jgi:hypothetical protein
MAWLRSLLLLLLLPLVVSIAGPGCSGDGGPGDDDDDDLAAGDDDDDYDDSVGDDDDDEMTDAGPPDAGRGEAGLCPFDETFDECRVLGDDGCEAGEVCYLLISVTSCDPEEDTCPEGTTCQEDPSIGQTICTDGSPLQPAGRCAVPRSNGAAGDPCGSGLHESDDPELATAYLDCGEGLSCDRARGVCASYCCADADCQVDEFCYLNQDPARGIGLCRACQGCEVAPNSGCGAGEGCFLVSGCATCEATPVTPLPEGSVCDAFNACGAGGVCVDTTADDEANFFCRRLCREEADLCDAGDRCETGIFAQDPNLGICVGS